jgi:hypothetical protein
VRAALRQQLIRMLVQKVRQKVRQKMSESEVTATTLFFDGELLVPFGKTAFLLIQLRSSLRQAMRA